MHKSIGIIATGSYLPEKILTSEELEKELDLESGWIYSKVGIKERRVADKNQTTSDLAAKASINALNSISLLPDDIDLVIVATTTPDYIMPSCACIVQDKIGAKNAGAFDITAVSAGFVYAIIIGSQFIMSGCYKNVLVIGAEISSRFINYKDKNTCILFGDGAGACILGEVENNYGLLSFELISDGSGAEYLKIPSGGAKFPITKEAIDDNKHLLYMEGKKVREYAENIPPELLKKTLKKINKDISDIDLLIPHQSNANIIKNVADKLNISQEKVFLNIEKYGNTSAASVAIALDEAVKQKVIKRDSILALLGYGSGLTSACAIFKWS